MQSKKFSCKWFSFGIWRKQTFRFWPIWASYLGLWLLNGPLFFYDYYDYGGESVGLDPVTYAFGRGLLDTGLSMICFSMAFYAVVAAMAVYSYLYQSRSVNLFHALPLRRETLFVTNFITGLGFLVGPNLILALYYALLQVLRGATHDFIPLLTWLAVTTLFAVFFFGLATLCAMATASLLMLPALYLIFSFLVVVLESILRLLGSMFLWGVTEGIMLYQKWSPVAYIMGYGFENNLADCISWENGHMAIVSYVRFQDWQFALLAGLAGVIFVVCALLLYRRWHSEAAGDIIAFSFLRPVFTYAWAAGCSLVLGLFVYSILGEGSLLGYRIGYDTYTYGIPGTAHSIFFAVCLLLGGTLGYFSAKMMHKKSFRVFTRRDWLGYAAFVAALLLAVLCMKTDILGIERWTPRVEELCRVQVEGEIIGEEDHQAVLDIHNEILRQKDTLQQQVLLHGDKDTGYVTYLNLEYMLRDGRLVERRYALLVEPDTMKDADTPVGMLYQLLESEEKRLERSGLQTFGTPAYAKVYMVGYGEEDWDNALYVHEEIQALIEALRADLTQGTLGVSDCFAGAVSQDKDQVWADVSITAADGNELYFYVTSSCTNTMDLIRQLMEDAVAGQEAGKTPELDDVIAGAN